MARRRRRIPRQRQPIAVERTFLRELSAVVEITLELARPLREQLPELVAQANRERADAGEGDRIAALMEALRLRVSGVVNRERLKQLLRRLGRRVADFNEQQLRQQVEAALGTQVFIPDGKTSLWIDGFVAENVALISSVPSTLLTRIETAATRAIAAGVTNRTFAKELNNEFGIARRRARVIARDQIGKLYGQINATRQQALGITHFTWRTANDERVRDSHEALNGQVFAFSEPPSEGLPGTPIQCRCNAEPVFRAVA